MTANYATHVIGAAAPLIALALSETAYIRAVHFTYTETAVIVRPCDTANRRVNKTAFGLVSEVFKGAGWEERINFTGGEPAREVRVYVPQWVPRL
jgi:hypothetical protein